MNEMVKVDERAFNEGVKEVLRMRPLVRIVRETMLSFHNDPKKTSEASAVVERKQR